MMVGLLVLYPCHSTCTGGTVRALFDKLPTRAAMLSTTAMISCCVPVAEIVTAMSGNLFPSQGLLDSTSSTV